MELISITLSVAAVSYVAHHSFTQRAAQDLDKRISIIANSLSTLLWTYDYDGINTLGDLYTTHQDIELLNIYSSPDGIPIFTYQKDTKFGTLVKSKDIITNDEIIGRVELSIDQSEHQNSINNIILSGALAALFLVVFTVFSTKKIFKSFLQKPIDAFSVWTSSIADGKYNTRLDIEEKELQKLAVNFKKMAKIIAARERKIVYQATHDHLTTLPNRLLIHDRLENLILQSERSGKFFAVILLDIDNFKKINDSLGHESGDKLLIQVSSILKSVIRESDTIGRLGGDEFIILLGPVKKVSIIKEIARKLLNSLSSKIQIESQELLVSASIGIACFPSDGKNVTDLIRNADTAMYHAKGVGRNTFQFFDQEMNADVSRKLLIEQEIHNGIKNDEFFLEYQPIIDVVSGAVIGAEALLRWNNSRIGTTPPDEFIPIAEQSGQIVELGKFVLRAALLQTKIWVESYNKEFSISVNLSPKQLHDENLLKFILKLLSDNNLQNNCLKLEITEGVLISGLSSTREFLEGIHKNNIKISMDDFGTGYSSLRYLRDYPFDTLKIDRIFIRKLTENYTDQELVNAIVAMANSLGIDVVAEGVESNDQLYHLKKIECKYAQGYFISRPLSASKFSKFLTNQ